MRSIGFKGYGLQDEDDLIRRAISAGIKTDRIFRNNKHGRAMIAYGVSPSAGVGIFGHMVGEKFVYDNHFPYLHTNMITKEKEIVIFKNLTGEKFSGMAENVKGDIPRVFFVTNPVDVLFDIDNKNAEAEYETEGDGALRHISVSDVNVAYSGLAIAASVILPAYDKAKHIEEKKSEKDDQEEEIRYLSLEETARLATGGGKKAAKRKKGISNIRRAEREDILSIVDTHIYPGGQVGEGYVILGNILGMREEENTVTGQSFYIMNLLINDERIEVAVNTADVIGEPKVGRRLNARMWMQGNVM